jgi:hypothetical protein
LDLVLHPTDAIAGNEFDMRTGTSSDPAALVVVVRGLR